MASLSRRSFVAGTLAIPFGLWLDKNFATQRGLVRYSALSSQGQLMLATYAKAVAIMHNSSQIGEGDPLSWVFQWYTHAVRSDRAKSAEIQRIYNNSGGAHQQLAADVWNTCQAHFDPNSESFFLPWHRMYLYFFERIVRKLSGNVSFTLPYWNYSASGSDHGAIPKQFRMKGDSAYGALYVQERNEPTGQNAQTPNVNQGEPIDKYDPGALDLSALAECTYDPKGVASGFNQTLDFGLHGNVHVDIGNTQNMGSIPWAAKDPIFWMHHCNIDRLWASWTRAGRKNPATTTFLNQQFIFAAEDGNKIAVRVADFLDTNALGYTYDSFETVPACAIPAAGLESFGANRQRLAATTSPVELGVGPIAIKLKREPGTESVPLRARLQSLNPAQHIYLVLRGLRANTQPGVLYHVYIDFADQPAPDLRTAQPVGVFNFFGSAHSEISHESDPRFLSFEITSLTKGVLQKGHLNGQPNVTISPSNGPLPEAKPVIGELSLVQQ
jgi:tyrosinase